jgi:hypothetical protein
MFNKSTKTLTDCITSNHTPIKKVLAHDDFDTPLEVFPKDCMKQSSREDIISSMINGTPVTLFDLNTKRWWGGRVMSVAAATLRTKKSVVIELMLPYHIDVEDCNINPILPADYPKLFLVIIE